MFSGKQRLDNGLVFKYSPIIIDLLTVSNWHDPMDKEQFTSTPPLSLKPPPKRILADAVTERLRDAILNGSFKPGQLLREEQLATMLDLSRGPVREALIRLEREGLVQVRRHRGTI